MASAAILIAPLTPVPEQGDPDARARMRAWAGLVAKAWEERQARDGLSWQQRSDVTHAYSSHYALPNGESELAQMAALQGEPELLEAARTWVETTYDAWRASGLEGPTPDNGPADYEACTGARSNLCLRDIRRGEGGHRLLSSTELPDGVPHGLLCLQSELGELESLAVGDLSCPELEVLTEILRIHGGEALVACTHGHAVHVRHFRTEAPGTRPSSIVASFRLRAPRGRRSHELATLRDSLKDSVLAPSWETVDALLAAPELSVTEWFAALGVPGVPELRPVDHDEVWETADRVATSLLRGRSADPEDVARLNAIIVPNERDHAIPTEPAAEGESLTWPLHDSLTTLCWSYGPPRSDRWRLPWDAADWYGELTEYPYPAGRRLTFGRTPLARAAGTGRLLGIYPTELLRDRLFFLMAGLELVEKSSMGSAFWKLAKTIDSAGFTISIHAAEDEDSFRELTGIDAHWSPTQAQVAHAFVDLETASAETVLDTLTEWHSARKSNGLIVRADADGTWTITQHAAGEVVDPSLDIDEERLGSAARMLTPREAVLALGLPDLLEPGDWCRLADRDDVREQDAEFRETTRQALAEDGELVELTGPDALPEAAGRVLRHDSKPNKLVAARLAPSFDDPTALDELRADLTRSDTWAWIEGDTVCLAASTVDTGHLSSLIADMPGPVRLTVSTGTRLVTYGW
ncbi:MAG: hypothetical protein AAF533_00775 [Acidobacteriota bacterium]